MVTAGRPYYGRLVAMDLAQARRALDEHLLLVLQVARAAADSVDLLDGTERGGSRERGRSKGRRTGSPLPELLVAQRPERRPQLGGEELRLFQHGKCICPIRSDVDR